MNSGGIAESPARFVGRLLSSVKIHNLDVLGLAIRSFETNSPWVINADTVLPSPAAFKFFKPVAREASKSRKSSAERIFINSVDHQGAVGVGSIVTVHCWLRTSLTSLPDVLIVLFFAS